MNVSERPRRGPGRPVGSGAPPREMVKVAISPAVVAELDRAAVERGELRAELIRGIVGDWLEARRNNGGAA